jgi:hypothetical protein
MTASGAPEMPGTRLRQFFNMCTYKIHALGHYIAAIARFGSTDGYSTQIVCIHQFVDTVLIQSPG